MDDQPIRKMQNSVRFSILHEQSAVKSHQHKPTILGSHRKDGVGNKRNQLEKKQHIDQKGFEVIIQELYSVLIGLNANFKELYKKTKLKTPAKQTFTEVLNQLLSIYDPNMASLNLSDEEVTHLLKDLGYPYSIRDDVLKIIGAPHNWQQAISLLHWLAQVVEAKVDNTPATVNQNPEADDFTDLLDANYDSEPPAKEDTMFDLARKGIEKRVRSDELAHNYLQQQDIPAEERKAGTKLRAAAEENKKLQTDIADCRSSQPSLIEIRKSLADLHSEIQGIRNKQNDARLYELQENTAIEEEKSRATVKELADSLQKIEARVHGQTLDVEAAKRMVRDTRELMNRLKEVRETLSKRKARIGEVNSTISQKHESLSELKTVADLQAASELRLTVSRNNLDEQATQEAVHREAVDSLQIDMASVERKTKELDGASKRLKDRMFGLEKEKSSKERDLESKKLSVNNEILSLNNQLDRLRKERNEIDFEVTSLEKESVQAKQVIQQGLEQMKTLMLSMKHAQVEKIRIEAERIEELKAGLLTCMRPRMKY